MNDPRYYEYYDRLYAGKDYAGEVEKILDLYRQITGTFPSGILDVGCGTGSHALCFARSGAAVTGVDLDEAEIDIARTKAVPGECSRPEFLCIDICDVHERNFDMAVSLFHVINYIQDIEYLRHFFAAISARLVPNGVFIFDCWNGVAALLDPPKIKKGTIRSEEEVIETRLAPELHPFEQRVHVVNDVLVRKGDAATIEFQYSYDQYLWTPAILRQLLNSSGFTEVDIREAAHPEVPATASSWKIMFIARNHTAHIPEKALG
jgi:SAM-dependent methyltransferase